MTTSTSSPLRIGILSTANIARQFAQGVSSSTKVTVSAVASRDAGKAERFAAELGIPRHMGSYEALLADPAVDAIYNPLPNGLHAEWSIRALEAGKHVLCEKPLATTAAEARAMFDTARRCGKHVVEGYPYRAQPQTLKLRELLNEGSLGKVQLIQATFGFTLKDGPNIRFDSALGGGALMDVGSYSVSLARMIAGERPKRVNAMADWTATGVDRTLVATIEFPGGLLVQVACSFATALHRQALIVGTDGVVETTFYNHPKPASPAVLLFKRGKGPEAIWETLPVPALNGFLAEAESFEQLIRHGADHWNGATPAESIDIMLTIEALLKSARSGTWVEIEPSN